jgi:hypothetical protein
MRESEPEPASAPARFLSEEEEAAAESADSGIFFASAAPGVATTVTVAAPQEKAVADHAGEPGSKRESVAAAREPRFEEVETGTQPPPRDYAADFVETPQGVMETVEAGTQQSASLYTEPNEQPERDLDVPTFLRRLKF